MMKRVSRVRKPVSITPFRPSSRFLALSTLWTRVWLFAQKYIPETGIPTISPSQGVAGSSRGLISLTLKSEEAKSEDRYSPPPCAKQATVRMMEPAIRIIAWISSALIAEDRPPGMVYEAASRANIRIISLRSAAGNTSLMISAAAYRAPAASRNMFPIMQIPEK